MKDVCKPLAKSVLILLGLTAAASATGAAIQKKMFVSGMTRLIISNKGMNIKKIVKSLHDLHYWYKALKKQWQMKRKNKKVVSLYIIRYTRW